MQKFATNNRFLRDKIKRMESESLQYSGSRTENMLSHADSVLSKPSQSLSIEPKKTTAFQDKALQCKALSIKIESQDDVEDYSSTSYGESMLGRTQIPLVGKKKVLEVRWNVDGNQLVFNMQKPLVKAIVESLTKRHILSTVNKFYNPLRILSPVIIKMKLLLQEISLTQTEWDEVLSEDLAKKWRTLVEELKDSDDVRVSRH